MKKSNEKGGAALEYLIVTIFAMMISLALLSFCGRLINEKLNETFTKLGIDPIEINLDFLG